MLGKNDVANYRKLSEPFADAEKANADIEKFFEMVGVARNECHIMDAHVIIKINVLRGDTETLAMTSAHYGNGLEGAGMCGWALGQEQNALNTDIARKLAGNTND